MAYLLINKERTSESRTEDLNKMIELREKYGDDNAFIFVKYSSTDPEYFVYEVENEKEQAIITMLLKSEQKMSLLIQEVNKLNNQIEKSKKLDMPFFYPRIAVKNLAQK